MWEGDPGVGAVISWAVSVFAADDATQVLTRRGTAAHPVAGRVFAADTAVDVASQRAPHALRLIMSISVADERLVAVIDTSQPLSLVALCRAMTAGDLPAIARFLEDL